MAGLGHERRADQLTEHVRHAVEAHLQRLQVPLPHQLPHLVDAVQVVLWEVLYLDEPACPAAGPACPIVLEQAPDAVVMPGGVQHRRVFGGAGLAQQLPELQDAAGGGVDGCRFELLDGGLVEAVSLDALHAQPVLELGDTVGVVQTRELLHLGRVRRREGLVDGHSGLSQFGVHQHPPIVYTGVQRPHAPLEGCHGVAAEAVINCLLHLHVPAAVLDEVHPPVRGVLWQIPRPAAVCDGRLAGFAKVCY